MRHMLFLSMIAALMLVIASCSGGSAITPDADSVAHPAGKVSGSPHQLWGLWQFIADPAAGTLEIIPLRNGNFHINVLPFLEPPPLVNLTLESLKFTGNIIDADIGLRHPFIGLTEFTGFDVCGIFITNGSITGFNDTALRMAGTGDTRLLNPDGYSRWWNPAEFPVNEGTMFSYNDGLLGAPDSVGNYNCTLNAYKYFTDSLGPNDPVSSVNISKRGMFSAGQKNIRHYKIELGADGLIFNYAVDACWKFPTGGPPWAAPDDFPPDANRSEAWRIKITETENTLWNDGTDNGGGLKLKVDVYDWFNAGLNKVRVESPGNFNMAESSTPTGGGAGYSTYEVDIIGATPAPGSIKLLMSVISEKADFEGFIPGTNITSYFTHTSPVSDESPIQPSPCKNIPLRDGVVAIDITIDHNNGDLLVIYSDKTIYRYYKADCYKTGELFITMGIHLPQDLYAFDIAPNQYIGISLTYVTTDTPGFFVYAPDGSFVQYFGQAPPHNLCDAYTMTAGSYINDMGFIRGAIPYMTTNYQTIVLRGTKIGDSYGLGNIYTFLITDGNTYGVDRVYYGFIKAAESDATGNYLWLIEDPDYYAARWELYMDGVYGKLRYDNAYLGTGSQTDADNGWNEAKDITRDNLNRYFVLDELSTGAPRVKVWTVSGNITTPIGGFGNSTTISGKPRRIEGSDFNGDIIVLHGDAPPYMVSEFYPNEMPGG